MAAPLLQAQIDISAPVARVWALVPDLADAGTRVVETRHAENGVKPAANMTVIALFGGVPNLERELVDGMNASLSRITAAAER
jgi:hypothetical protein